MLGIPPLGTRTPLAAWILVCACASPTSEADFPAADEVGASDAEALSPSGPNRPAMDWVPSAHFGRGTRTRKSVDAIAIHTTEGGYDSSRSHAENQRRNYRGTINYFKKNDRKVSAHFLIGPGGEITQMVRERDVAHTTTYYNARSFGIECAGWSARKQTWTPKMLDSLVELCAYLSVTWDIPVVHPTGNARKGPHRRRTNDPNRPRFDAAGIVGHDQVQPWNKSDPGAHFPWPRFIARVHKRVEALRPPVPRPPVESGESAPADGGGELGAVRDLPRASARRRTSSAGTARPRT